MKGEFITYDALSSGTGSTQAPKLHVAKYGVISINASAVNLIGLKKGDQVKLIQNKQKTKDWYLTTVKEGGLVLRSPYDKKSKGLIFNCSSAAKAMMISLNLPKGFNVSIGKEPDEDGWWSLITSAVK